MSTSHNQNSPLSRSLLNVTLVLIESVLTLILRFDYKLRQAAYPLAKQETLVAIRTYLPHTQIYATFGYKGVLLDDELPPNKSEPDVIINAYSYQLFNALIGHNPKIIDALQMRGESEQVALVKDFLLQIGIGGLIQNLIHKIKPDHHSPEEKAAQKQNKLTQISQELAEKITENEALTLENKRLKTQLAEANSKQKTTVIALVIASIIALIAIIMHFV